MLEIEKWINLRQQEQDFQYANGFNNGDPKTNGEYLCTDYFMNLGIDTFCDIGTNVGIFSKRILEKYPEVFIHSFEPNPKHLEILKTLEQDNQSLTFYPLALGDKKGKFDFHHHPVHHETSSLSRRHLMSSEFQKEMKTIEVNVECLDNFNIKSNNLFLKIDTEGNEFPILRGSENTITNTQTSVILFEYSFGWKETKENIELCFQYLNNLGFDFYRVLPIGLEEIRFITTDMQNIQYCNYMAIKSISFDPKQILNVPSQYAINKVIQL